MNNVAGRRGIPSSGGIIAGTSGDAEESQCLLGEYKQLGLSDAHIQTINLFHPLSRVGGGPVGRVYPEHRTRVRHHGCGLLT